MMYLKKNMAKKALAAVAALTLTATSVMQTGAIKLDVKAASTDNYAKLLQQSLFFYDANMCGKTVKSEGLMTWRDNCHTSDEVDGGFHDAGDHAMFGLPQGYSASTLGWAYYEFKDSFDSLGVTSHYKTIADHFATFFKNSTKLDGSGNVTNFLYQKGDGNEDHSYWGKPEDQTGSRKMYWTSNGASDIAAEYAAALAVNYINFGNTEDLKYAKALYKFSLQYNQCATEGPSGFYDSKVCADEQAWAAGWLYLATNEGSYLSDLKSKLPEIGWVHGWNDTHLGAACLLGHATGDWSKANSYVSGKAQGSSYFFLDKWGSARINCSMQFVSLVVSKNTSSDYTAWAKNQMNYILGQNPANTCFVIGYSDNCAKNPHHRAASGYSSYNEFPTGEGSYATVSSSNSKLLVGALVGGPEESSGTYHDNMNDYVCNEVALDYNAGLVGAAAGLYSVYKTGSVESTIVGAKSNGADSSYTPPATTTAPSVTTAPPSTTKAPTTTTKAGGSSSQAGVYELQLNQAVDYSALPKDDKMIGWEWADFKIPSSENITKVEVNISSTKNIGKWQGAFGSSTTVSPEYWTQTDDMSQTISGTSGTITWEIDSATSKIIQRNYKGQLKFGIWWIDCTTFTIDSIKVYTDGSGSGSVVTAAPVTTKAPTTTTTKTPSTSNGGYTLQLNQAVDYSALPKDDKMIGWEWADFKIPSSENVTKVEVNISSTKNIGKWQGAFGSSTTVSPEYWTQTDDMSQTISGTSGTITWNVDSATSKIIQRNYKGELKFGIWWIDCTTFTIDSITVYTDGNGGSSAVTTVATTKAPVYTTTTKAPTSNVTGDVNQDGAVSASDIVSLMQALVGKITLNSNAKASADLNNDGKISIIDLIMLKNKLV